MNLRNIQSLVQYSFAKFPLFFFSLVLSLVSVGVELTAMSVLFPLAELAGGRSLPSNALWVQVLDYCGLVPTVRILLVLFLVFLFLRTATLFVSSLLVAWLNRQLIAHFSSQAFSLFIRTLTFEEVNEKSIGHFINLAGDEANRACQIVISLNRLLPVGILSALYYFAIMVESPIVGIAVLVFIALAGISLISAFRVSHDLGLKQREESRALNSHFMDGLNSLRSVRALTAEGFITDTYRALIARYAMTCYRGDLVNYLARFIPAMVLLAVGVVGVLAYASAQVLASRLSFLIVVLMLLMRFFPVLGEAVDVFMRVVADLKVGSDISHILERTNAEQVPQQPEANRLVSLDRIRNIQLNTVDFSYQEGTQILNNMNLTFESGKSYAIVGPSGVGKSTIADLLLRFYDADSGMICINGNDIRDFEPAVLRSKIIVVEQQARVFNSTIYSNIAFGRPAHLEDVRRACKLACIDEDIMNFPLGYETVISYQGGNLSGGQRQRIALARAFVGKADVLVLDESTNALDVPMRKQVIENILAAYTKGIVIFITHDLSLTEWVDVVIDLARNKDQTSPVLGMSHALPDQRSA